MSACYVSDDPMTLDEFHGAATEAGFGRYWPDDQEGPTYVDEDGNKAGGVRYWGNRVLFSRYATHDTGWLEELVGMTGDYDDDFARLLDAANRSARRKSQYTATYPARP